MAKDVTYEDILRSVKSKSFVPIYFLMGEEDYYIDQISDYIVNTVLSETEKEFNLTILYAADTDVSTVINAAKRYPMMSEHQVVVVREAQALKDLDKLAFYLQKPLLSTILVFCYKHGVLDRRKKIAAEIEKHGVLFESKKLKETQLPGFISAYLKRKSVDIESKASELMAEYVGGDLSRLASELDKLVITLPQGCSRVTTEQIERNIGISKDYNALELRNALMTKDILKTNKIVKYFENNPKNNPLPRTLATIFGLFSNLMLAYYAPSKTEQGIAQQLGLRNSWQARDYIKAMQLYTGRKVLSIIDAIRIYDARSKGVDSPSTTSDGELLRELVYIILH